MTDRTDKTSSPQPNRLAQLYAFQSDLEHDIGDHENMAKSLKQQLRNVRSAIKRANGDSGAKI